MPSYKQSFFQTLCQIDDKAERQRDIMCKNLLYTTDLLLSLFIYTRTQLVSTFGRGSL
jgi:hypothetical protein